MTVLKEANVAEIQLIYRSPVRTTDRMKITSPYEACTAFRCHWDPDRIELQEEFKILLLDQANHVIGCINIGMGGIGGATVDVKLILSAALLARASGIICAHNHPSGNLQPSEQDEKLTKKLQQGAELLDLKLLDHLILTADNFYSFADNSNL